MFISVIIDTYINIYKLKVSISDSNKTILKIPSESVPTDNGNTIRSVQAITRSVKVVSPVEFLKCGRFAYLVKFIKGNSFKIHCYRVSK